MGIMNRLSVDHRLRRELGVELNMAKKQATAIKEEPSSPAFDLSKQLWPQKLPVIGGSGKYESGKTLFGLSICPGPQTICYDFEDSSEPYESIGFDRIDVPDVLASTSTKYDPELVFTWWRDHVLKTPAGKYRVMVVDPITDIESGLVAYVSKRPQEFGYTPAQFARMEGVKWECVKQLWKSILLQVAQRVETFYFVAHAKREWIGSTPTANVIPKGKATLMELASLYLFFDRTPVKGVKPKAPAANVLKTRLTRTVVVNGDLKIIPILPPRLPEATPAAIRAYMLNPANYDKLSEAEKYIETPVSEAEMLALKTNLAETELQTEALRVDRMSIIARHNPAAVQQQQEAANVEHREEVVATAESTPSENGASTNKEAVQDSLRPSLQFSEGQSAAELHSVIERFKNRLGFTDDQWSKVMAKRGVQATPELDQGPAFDLCKILAARIEEDSQGK